MGGSGTPAHRRNALTIASSVSTPALPRLVIVGWALGQLPIAAHIGIVSFYLLYFLTDVHHIPPAWAGIALLVPRLFNIIFDPVMGAVSDRTRSRFGRRRPYLLGGAILWGAAIIVLFGLPVSATPARGVIALLAAFMVVSMGQTLYHVPYSAMMPEMTGISAERISLASWKETVSRLGVLIAASTTPVLVALFPTEVAGYRAAGIVFGLVIAVGGLVAFITTARAPCLPTDNVRIGLRSQLAALIANRPFRLLVGAWICIMIADEVFSSCLIYYAVNVLGQTASFVGKAYPISSIAAILVIPAWNALAKRSGKTPALIVATIGMAFAWASVLFIPADHGWLMLPLMAVIGAFNAGLLMIPCAMVPDTVEHDTARTGQRREGAIYGAWIFCQQSAMAAGGFILSMALTVMGYQPGATVQHDVAAGLKLTIAALPAGILMIALLLVLQYRSADRVAG